MFYFPFEALSNMNREAIRTQGPDQIDPRAQSVRAPVLLPKKRRRNDRMMPCRQDDAPKRQDPRKAQKVIRNLEVEIESLFRKFPKTYKQAAQESEMPGADKKELVGFRNLLLDKIKKRTPKSKNNAPYRKKTRRSRLAGTGQHGREYERTSQALREWREDAEIPYTPVDIWTEADELDAARLQRARSGEDLVRDIYDTWARYIESMELRDEAQKGGWSKGATAERAW